MLHTIVTAFTGGFGRVRRAPAVLFGTFLLILVVTLLPGLLVRDMVATGLGNSRDADVMANGVSLEWWDRFGESAVGLGRSFSPTVIGFAAVLDNISRVADGRPAPAAIVALVVVALAGWCFLSGGILDRLARSRPLRSRAFFGACGALLPRFVRLNVIGLAGYWVLFAYWHPWLFDTVWGSLVRNVAAERTAAWLMLVMYAAFGLPLLAWNVVLDYARIRTVVEDRRSVLGALVAGARFVATHPSTALGLYALNALAFLLAIGAYALVAPGAGRVGWPMWVGFATGELYVLVRLALKLTFWSSQIALFEQSMAHAAYIAGPVPVWPESPAAEAIANAATLAAMAAAPGKQPD